MLDRFERFTAAIFELTRYWHKITSDEMAKYSLKGPYAVYLTNMYRHPDGITATGLCELCGRDKADVSRAVALMEEKKLVFKEGNSYRALLRLTDEGMLAAEQVNERARKAVELGGMGISDEHRAIFYQTLDRISTNLRTLSEQGLPE